MYTLATETGGMFDFMSDVVSGVGDLLSVAMTAPLVYFLGLALLGSVVGIILKIIKRR